MMSSAPHTPHVEFVSWFDWTPDPERAFREHDPLLEPYASMSKEQLLEAMLNARGGGEWDFLQEFFLDRCTEAELAVDRETFLHEQFGMLDEDMFCFLSGVAGMATRICPNHARPLQACVSA